MIGGKGPWHISYIFNKIYIHNLFQGPKECSITPHNQRIYLISDNICMVLLCLIRARINVACVN